MGFRKYSVFAGILLLSLSACKKENQKEEQQQIDLQDGPLVSNGADHWALIPNQYIITYTDTTSADGSSAYIQRQSVMRNYTRVFLEKHRISSLKLIKTFNSGVNGFSAVLSRDEVEKLSRDPAIRHIEPDRIIKLSDIVIRPYSSSTQKLPWGIKKVGFADGTGKTCWIIDTGIDFTHPDLNIDIQRSKSFLDNDSSASDMNGHGTHVAGIVGAKDNDFGVIGVAPNATLVSLRALDENGSGNLSNVIAAVTWASAHAAPGDVVNMSIGGGDSPSLDKAVYNASMKGIFFSISAGNDGKSVDLNSPAKVNSPYICTVSAMNPDNVYANFSNYGNPPVDWCAPGTGILSTYTGGKYASLSGTSMAAPHVAGLLLLKGMNIRNAGPVKNDPDGEADPIAHL
jgi:subtilisin